MVGGPADTVSGFSLALMVKDIHIALDLAATIGRPARHAASTVALCNDAAATLGPDADHTEIVRWLRGEARPAPESTSAPSTRSSPAPPTTSSPCRRGAGRSRSGSARCSH